MLSRGVGVLFPSEVVEFSLPGSKMRWIEGRGGGTKREDRRKHKEEACKW